MCRLLPGLSRNLPASNIVSSGQLSQLLLIYLQSAWQLLTSDWMSVSRATLKLTAPIRTSGTGEKRKALLFNDNLNLLANSIPSALQISRPEVTRHATNVWKADRTIAALVLDPAISRFAAMLMGWKCGS